MKMKRKQFICALLAAAVCGLAACGAPQEPVSTAESESRTEMTSDQLGAASAAEPEGGIGEVYFLPFSYDALMGTNMLAICAKKSGLQPGGGTLTLYREDGTLVEEIAFTGAEQVELSPLTEDDKSLVGWEDAGTRASIILQKPLTEEGGYYVIMTENCLVDPQTGIGSKPLTDKKAWSFGVTGYGITGEGSLLTKDVCAVGEMETVVVRLGNGAVKAVLTGYDPEMVEPVVGERTTDGELSMKFKKAGTAWWSVVLLDAAGEVLDGASISVSVE